MHRTPTAMYHVRGYISLIAVCATSMASRTSTPRPWARPSVSASPLSRLGVWVCEEIVNTTVSGSSICQRSSIIDVFYSLFFLLIDCGIRPATAAEAEWLQDYIQKSNNNAAQASVNAARQAEAANRAEDRSDEDEDDGSEGANSVSGSKRNSLLLQGDVKNLPFDDLSDKTPTAATLLSQAQSVSRPTGTYPPTASIRRYPAQETNLTLPSASASSVGSGGYVTPQPNSSVRQFPNFPSIEDAVANSTSAHGMVAREVWSWFQDHLDALLESIRTFRIDQFEMHLRTFWTSLNGVHREIVHAPAIAGIMAKADAMVYDVCCQYFILLCFI